MTMTDDRQELTALRGILSAAHGALADAGSVVVPATLDQPIAGAIRALVAELAALKAAPCPCCGAMAEDYVKGRCLDVDNDPGVFTSGEPHD
jgi:hypothetical protein